MKGGGENCTRAKDCEYRGVSQGQVVKKLERFLLINLQHGSFGRIGAFNHSWGWGTWKHPTSCICSGSHCIMTDP